MKSDYYRKWDKTTLEKVYDSLLEELPLASNAPGGMIKYRRTLTLRCDISLP
jgi:hypothetical protein